MRSLQQTMLFLNDRLPEKKPAYGIVFVFLLGIAQMSTAKHQQFQELVLSDRNNPFLKKPSALFDEKILSQQRKNFLHDKKQFKKVLNEYYIIDPMRVVRRYLDLFNQAYSTQAPSFWQQIYYLNFAIHNIYRSTLADRIGEASTLILAHPQKANDYRAESLTRYLSRLEQLTEDFSQLQKLKVRLYNRCLLCANHHSNPKNYRELLQKMMLEADTQLDSLLSLSVAISQESEAFTLLGFKNLGCRLYFTQRKVGTVRLYLARMLHYLTQCPDTKKSTQ